MPAVAKVSGKSLLGSQSAIGMSGLMHRSESKESHGCDPVK